MTDEERSRALAELLATPLDEITSSNDDPETRGPRSTAPWGVLLAIVIGAFTVLAGYWLAADDPAEESPTVVTTLPPTTAPAVDNAAVFPPGFTEIDDTVAVKVVRVAGSGQDLAVTMISAAPRGIDAALSTPFTGGRWTAVLRDGSTVAARGQIADGATPGVVTALFDPAVVTAENLASLRISERWFNQSTGAIQELPITELPWTSEEPVLVDLGDGVSLIVETMELTETGGVVEWSLAGGTALGVVTVEIAIEEGFFDGQPRMMIPIGRIDRFFFDPATAVPQGRIELAGPTEAAGEGIGQVFADWSVRLTVTAPADALIPVPEPPE